jgi:hypothetical protein
MDLAADVAAAQVKNSADVVDERMQVPSEMVNMHSLTEASGATHLVMLFKNTEQSIERVLDELDALDESLPVTNRKARRIHKAVHQRFVKGQLDEGNVAATSERTPRGAMRQRLATSLNTDPY